MGRALPRVGQPYELTTATLRTLRSGPRSIEALATALKTEGESRDVTLNASEVQDWLGRALELTRLRGETIALTEIGQTLADVEGTSAFDCQFFLHLRDRSPARFSYFEAAVQALELRATRGDDLIAKKDLDELLSTKIANRTSGPAIRRLLIGVGMLLPYEGSYRITRVCRGDDVATSPELSRIMKTAEQLISLDQLSWEALIHRLEDIHGTELISQYRNELRGRAKIASTRSVDYVVGFTGS